MPIPRPLDLAKIAYQAYGDSTGWKNYQGLPMPAWDDLGEPIQVAWVAAAGAVYHAILTPPPRSGSINVPANPGRTETPKEGS